MAEEKENLEEETTEEVIEEQVENQEVKEEEKAPEKNEWQDKYIRLVADFENYKKRTSKEITSSYGNGKVAAIEEILPVIDNFDRAISSIEEDDSQFAQGIKMVAKQLYDALSKLGVKPIEAKGQKFDPNFHNAVMHIEDDSFGESEVVEELLKGYICGDRVIRYSMVKVAN